MDSADTPSSAPVAAPGNEVLPEAPGQLCPNCDLPLAADAVICTQCGFNLETGERLEAGRLAVGSEAPPAATALQTILDFFPGLYYPGVIVLAVLCAGLSCGLAFFTVIVFALGAFMSAGALGVATLAVWTQAVTLMCVGRAEFFNTALGDIEGTQFGVFLALVMAPPVAIWTFFGWLSTQSGG